MKQKAQQVLSIAVTTALLSMPGLVGAQDENALATHSATLQSVESCPNLLAELKQVAIEEMEKKMKILQTPMNLYSSFIIHHSPFIINKELK